MIANKKELVTDLVVKAKQVEYLIQSLPEPEAEENQVRVVCPILIPHSYSSTYYCVILGCEITGLGRRDDRRKRRIHQSRHTRK